MPSSRCFKTDFLIIADNLKSFSVLFQVVLTQSAVICKTYWLYWHYNLEKVDKMETDAAL